MVEILSDTIYDITYMFGRDVYSITGNNVSIVTVELSSYGYEVEP